jgi:hypothetical protein
MIKALSSQPSAISSGSQLATIAQGKRAES